ncbi:hypothetical protein BDB00DRAFT_872856 [Zychaea mexicana]|uniref:uncharacterized protein n=1 Tax=Zychaea mexicana TaxID=64656 RepID=UPI0022FE4246|nr:uncharacterized protein BDB00DRAFT_872856 [Zychaea mexicana]KAI9492995.1 hypothetical protein BDB00DRAFT_872856 [Zychaea mexicana]
MDLLPCNEQQANMSSERSKKPVPKEPQEQQQGPAAVPTSPIEQQQQQQQNVDTDQQDRSPEHKPVDQEDRHQEQTQQKKTSPRPHLQPEKRPVEQQRQQQPKEIPASRKTSRAKRNRAKNQKQPKKNMSSTARSPSDTMTSPDDSKQQYKKSHPRRPADRRKRRTVPRGESVKEPTIVSPSPPPSPSLKQQQQQQQQQQALMSRRRGDKASLCDDNAEDPYQLPSVNEGAIVDPYLGDDYNDSNYVHKEDWKEEGQQSPMVEEPCSQDEPLNAPCSQYDPRSYVKQQPQQEDDMRLSQQHSTTAGSHHHLQTHQLSAEELGRLLQNNLQFDPPREEVNLTGERLDASGNVLDSEGNIIGTVVKDDWSHVAGKKVNEHGEIVDLAGNVYGKVRPSTSTSRQPSKDNNSSGTDSKKRSGISFSNSNGSSDDLVVNVDATKGGISFSIHIPRPQ